MTEYATTEPVHHDPDLEQDNAIKRRMQSRISYYVDHPEGIGPRLAALDREWTIEQAMSAGSAAIGFGGALLGASRSRKWLALPVLISGFLAQQAIQGWSPAYPALRRLGLRTRHEVEQERYALMALRGDFDKLNATKNKLTAIFRLVGIEPR